MTSSSADGQRRRRFDDLVAVYYPDMFRYAAWLSEKAGRLFRLPTEAEWEYACRAGTGAVAESALAQRAWFEPNSNGVYHPVGTREANPAGLFDLRGNVAEWVLDEYDAEAYAGRAGDAAVDPVTRFAL